MTRPFPRSHPARLLAVIAAVALSVSACNGSEEEPEQPAAQAEPACGMVDEDSLREVLGDVDLDATVSGGLDGSRCEVTDDDTGKTTLLITTHPADDSDDLVNSKEQVAEEKPPRCEPYQEFSAGYLCVQRFKGDQDQFVTQVAGVRSTGLIRIVLYSPDQPVPITRAQADDLLGQVDTWVTDQPS